MLFFVKKKHYVKKIQVERFNKDMASIFRMSPQQLQEQFIKFE